MAESIHGYLHRVHREPVPKWLEEDAFSLDRFFESRTVYYPGAGCDGSPIKLFNRSHNAHCFLWVDQRYDFDQMKTMGELDLKGYEIRHARQMDLEIRTDYRSPVGNTSCSHMVAYDRRPGFGDKHGATNLAILFVRAEAHSAYEQIYGGRFKENPPFAVVIQDHGLGGDLTGHSFGGSDSPIFHAAQRSGFPRFLLCGIGHGGTRVWPRYAKVHNIRSTFGGTVGNSTYGTTERWLYQRRADERREHAERVRPHL